MPFGHSDGGGGPTRTHVEFVRRAADLEGVPRMRTASPVAYFRDTEADATALPRYVGELYYQAHRGTYTSQAKTKRGNRKSELALRDAEMWAPRPGLCWLCLPARADGPGLEAGSVEPVPRHPARLVDCPGLRGSGSRLRRDDFRGPQRGSVRGRYPRRSVRRRLSVQLAELGTQGTAHAAGGMERGRRRRRRGGAVRAGGRRPKDRGGRRSPRADGRRFGRRSLLATVAPEPARPRRRASAGR